jgi:hypothetical protein
MCALELGALRVHWLLCCTGAPGRPALGTVALVRRLRFIAAIEQYALRAAPFVIGSLAAFWLFERVARFLT